MRALQGPPPLRRAPLRSLRPLVLPALLSTAGIVLGGTPGLIVIFFGVLLAIDRLLDRLAGFTGWGMSEAERSFRRVTRERRRGELRRRLARRPPADDQLVYLPDDDGWAATASRRRLGVQAIPVASIVGTSDRHKAATFDRGFRPPRWSRGRWTLMCFAMQAGAQLPPISVYRIGDEHYVLDGHHRVSVARALGAESIDAEVTELRPATAASTRG
jgi:hypothetical protein